MPAILGPFESSLRGRGGCGGGEAGDQKARMVLHHSCSGASHGYGVKKERRTSDKAAGAGDRERRNLSLPPDIGPGHVPDILLDTHVSGTGHTCGAQHSV